MLEPFEHHEPAKDADPTFPIISSFAHIKDLTPSTGSVVSGLQLSSLTRQAKDELALLVAQRKDFKDLPISSVVNFCKYFGPLVIFPLGPYLPGCPEIHIAHNGVGDTRLRDIYAPRTTSMSWHTDSSANAQPPGLVFLYMLECPEVGGDTVFINTAQAYKKLSRSFAQRLQGLKAEHKASTGVTSVHPVVRTHPVTGEKSLFVNPLYTTHIIDFKKEESDALLKFLFEHLAYSQDCQVRVQWTEDTVVIFDNRAVAHSAIFDFVDDQRRHLARVSPAAERPYETPLDEIVGK
ncbi:MAG: hypothetical protein Q9161_009303 [Pseudevernia consocians]